MNTWVHELHKWRLGKAAPRGCKLVNNILCLHRLGAAASERRVQTIGNIHISRVWAPADGQRRTNCRNYYARVKHLISRDMH